MCAAEAAARHLPLKRQSVARLRAHAESRVYPRTYDSAVPRPLISHIQQLVSPFDDLSQVERFLEDGTGIVLEPGAHVLCLGVTTHDGDLSRERRMAVNQGQ